MKTSKITFKERFFGVKLSDGRTSAPMTLPPPHIKYIFDATVFKKNKGEKDVAKSIRKDHIKTVKAFYKDGYKKQLNIPSLQINPSLKGTF